MDRNKKKSVKILRNEVKAFLKSHHPSFCKPVSKLGKNELINHLKYLDIYANYVAPEKREIEKPMSEIKKSNVKNVDQCARKLLRSAGIQTNITNIRKAKAFLSRVGIYDKKNKFCDDKKMEMFMEEWAKNDMDTRALMEEMEKGYNRRKEREFAERRKQMSPIRL
jgi:hypothetical protein